MLVDDLRERCPAREEEWAEESPPSARQPVARLVWAPDRFGYWPEVVKGLPAGSWAQPQPRTPHGPLANDSLEAQPPGHRPHPARGGRAATRLTTLTAEADGCPSPPPSSPGAI